MHLVQNQQFNEIWLNKYAPNNCILVYATGRNFEKFELAAQEWDILKPDILISQDGVNIHWFNKTLAQQVQSQSIHKIGKDLAFDDNINHEDFLLHDKAWEDVMKQGWNQNLAEQIHDELVMKYDLLPLPHASKSLEPFRIGVLCKGYETSKEIERYINQRIDEYNENNKDNNDGFIPMSVHTYTAAEGYEPDAYWSAATPVMTGKGSAIEFLRNKLEMKQQDIICVGDSGNDISMMEIEGVNGVLVANASHELVSFYEEMHKKSSNGDGKNKARMMKADKPNTLGVIEGLNHYGQIILHSK